MKATTIEFQQVEIGDEVYMTDHFNRSHPFERCTGIEKSCGYIALVVGVSAHKTIDTRTRIVGHPREAVTVIRGISA